MTVARYIEMIRRKEIVGYVAGQGRHGGHWALADLGSGVKNIDLSFGGHDPLDVLKTAFYDLPSTGANVQKTIMEYPHHIVVDGASIGNDCFLFFLGVAEERFDPRRGANDVVVLKMSDPSRSKLFYQFIQDHTNARSLFEAVLREGGEGTRHLLGATDRTVGVHMVQ